MPLHCKAGQGNGRQGRCGVGSQKIGPPLIFSLRLHSTRSREQQPIDVTCWDLMSSWYQHSWVQSAFLSTWAWPPLKLEVNNIDYYWAKSRLQGLQQSAADKKLRMTFRAGINHGVISRSILWSLSKSPFEIWCLWGRSSLCICSCWRGGQRLPGSEKQQC